MNEKQGGSEQGSTILEFGYEQAGINKTKLRGRKIWKLNQKPTKIVNL